MIIAQIAVNGYKMVIFFNSVNFSIFVTWHPTVKKNFLFLTTAVPLPPPFLSLLYQCVLLDSSIIFHFLKIHCSHYLFRFSEFLGLVGGSPFNLLLCLFSHISGLWICSFLQKNSKNKKQFRDLVENLKKIIPVCWQAVVSRGLDHS